MKKIITCIMLISSTSLVIAQRSRKSNVKSDRIEQRKQDKIEDLKKELDLSDDQVKKIKVLNAAYDKLDREETEQKSTSYLQDRNIRTEKYDSEMKTILTAIQYKKWKKKQEERIETISNYRNSDKKK